MDINFKPLDACNLLKVASVAHFLKRYYIHLIIYKAKTEAINIYLRMNSVIISLSF